MNASPLPDFLASTYRKDALDRVDASIAALDASARILWVNAGWYTFARVNGGPTELPAFTNYVGPIHGPLRTWTETVLQTALASGEVFEHDYECSTPDAIRTYRMRVLPFGAEGLLVEHSEIESHAAPPSEPAIEALYVDADGQIVQCSNCRKIRRPLAGERESWAWVREWVAASHPRISHGLCTPCAGYYWRRRRPRP